MCQNQLIPIRHTCIKGIVPCVQTAGHFCTQKALITEIEAIGVQLEREGYIKGSIALNL